MLTPALLFSLSLTAVTSPGSAEPSGADLSPPPVVTAPGLGSGPRLLATVDGVERFRFSRSDAVPEGYSLVTKPRWGLIGGGIGALAGGYLAAAALGYFRGSATSLIPIAGPIMQLATDWSGVSWSSGSWGGATNFLVGFGMVLYSCLPVIMSIAQVAGIVMIITGASAPQRWLEKKKPAVELSLAPGSAAGPVGASLVGRF